MPKRTMLPPTRLPEVCSSAASTRTCSTCCARRSAATAKTHVPRPAKMPMAPLTCANSASVYRLICLLPRLRWLLRLHSQPPQEDRDDRRDMLLIRQPVGPQRWQQQLASELRQ